MEGNSFFHSLTFNYQTVRCKKLLHAQEKIAHQARSKWFFQESSYLFVRHWSFAASQGFQERFRYESGLV